MDTSVNSATTAGSASRSHFESIDYVPVTYVSFWAEGAVRAAARLNLRTGVVDEIASSEHGADFEHLIEEGIEAVGRPLYARTAYCSRLNAYRVKRASLVKAFGVGDQRRDVRGDVPPPSCEYASPQNQPAWSPDPYERLANLIRASLIRAAEARGEPCKEDTSARISCRLNPQTGLIELFDVLENGDE